MGLSQTMITTAFLVLLTVAVYNANKMIIDKNENYYKQEAIKEAGYLATSLLEEISKCKFHHQIKVGSNTYPDTANYSNYPDPYYAFESSLFGPGTINRNNVNPNNLPDSLFPFKSMYYFDDVDDYDGYFRSADEISHLKGFKLKVRVYYVDTALNQKTNPTYLKKVDVKVWNPNYLVKYRTDNETFYDTLLFTTVFSF